jgi:Tfp pilus assembly protein FimT
MALIAVPAWNQTQRNQEVKSAGVSVVKALSLARSEAIRTGNNHIVFFMEDTADDSLSNAAGDPVAFLVIDDQAPGSPDQNCQIDTGEKLTGVPAEAGVNWGVTHADTEAPFDGGGADYLSGFTFTQTGTNGGAAATWVLFNSRGMATPFKADCTLAGGGTGGGAVYLTNGARDYAIVVNGLGGIQTYAWNGQQGSWSN